MLSERICGVENKKLGMGWGRNFYEHDTFTFSLKKLKHFIFFFFFFSLPANKKNLILTLKRMSFLLCKIQIIVKLKAAKNISGRREKFDRGENFPNNLWPIHLMKPLYPKNPAQMATFFRMGRKVIISVEVESQKQIAYFKI